MSSEYLLVPPLLQKHIVGGCNWLISTMHCFSRKNEQLARNGGVVVGRFYGGCVTLANASRVRTSVVRYVQFLDPNSCLLSLLSFLLDISAEFLFPDFTRGFDI